MEAITYKSTTVNNVTAINVVNTDEYLLALRPGNSGSASIEEGGWLSINLDQGFGFQNKAIYEFDNIFYIKNKASSNIAVTWEVNERLQLLINSGALKIYHSSHCSHWQEWHSGSVLMINTTRERGVKFVFDTQHNYQSLNNYKGEFIINAVPK